MIVEEKVSPDVPQSFEIGLAEHFHKSRHADIGDALVAF
jgi:hypothetical protein